MTDAAAGRRIRLQDSDIEFESGPGESILSAARRAGVWLPFECGWGSCATCKVTLVEGAVDALFPQAPAITPRDARRGRVLACQSSPSSDVVIRPTSVSRTAPDFAPRRLGAVVVDNEQVGTGIHRLRLQLPEAVSFREGQHAIIEVGDGLRRCYSMATPSGSGRVDFLFKHYPGRPGSTALAGLAAGDRLDVDLPYGDVWVRDGADPLCFVAGGTGVAPMVSMLHALVRDGDTRPVSVCYGAATAGELACLDEVDDLVSTLGGRLGLALTTVDGGGGSASTRDVLARRGVTPGLVTQVLQDWLPDLGAARFHIAGPPVMATATRQLLTDHGVDVRRVHYDSFG